LTREFKSLRSFWDFNHAVRRKLRYVRAPEHEENFPGRIILISSQNAMTRKQPNLDKHQGLVLGIRRIKTEIFRLQLCKLPHANNRQRQGAAIMPTGNIRFPDLPRRNAEIHTCAAVLKGKGRSE
jgi:hypothetical protein